MTFRAPEEASPSVSWIGPADHEDRREMMQTRLIASLAGGLLGASLTSTANTILGLSPTVAMIGCSAVGIALGYVISMLFDVFAMSGDQN